MLSGKPQGFDDASLVRRIRDAYAKSIDVFGGLGESQWSTLNDWKGGIHHTILSGSDEAAREVFRNPAGSNFFWGFDVIDEARTKALMNDEAVKVESATIETAIERLAIAVGVARTSNPEAPDHRPPEKRTFQENLDECDLALPFVTDFPNPYENEFGLDVDGQAASIRAVLAMYQAYKTHTVAGITGCKSVLEIGAGLGRAAFYCYKAGIKDYSIVDIPLTGAAQAYFLGRVLGEDRVSLFGEEPKKDAIRILPPSAINDVRCEMTVNVDSFTEMDRGVAEGYIAHALDQSKVLFSINHEVNSFTVNEIIRSRRPDARVLRNGSPVRAGYMEEIVFIR